MKLSTIKQILRDNKNSLLGKKLQVNGTTYKTLREFGTAILELSKQNDVNLSMMVYLSHNEMCLSVEHSLRYTLENERFDTVKVYSNNKSNKVITDYSNVDFKAFGTTA